MRSRVTEFGTSFKKTGEYQVARELPDGNALIATVRDETFDIAIVDLISIGARSTELISQSRILHPNDASSCTMQHGRADLCKVGV